MDIVEAARARGGKAWLFLAVSTERGKQNWSQRFSKCMRELGFRGRKGLHSLRHNFKDALRAGGVPEDLSDALTGHSGGGVGRRYGARARHAKQRHKVIIERFGMKRMVEAIEKVEYPSIDLQALRSAFLADKR